MLGELLRAISALDGFFWVRLLYLHPDHFPAGILEIMADDRRFLPYFDIPFQHASEPLLRRMNRRGGTQSYLLLIETIREKLPDAIIRSTFLVGFPGESDDDFQELLNFQSRARLDWLGTFCYSREENTTAWSFKTRPGKKIMLARKKIVEERQIPITEKQMDRFTGRKLTALVEEQIDGEEGLYLGRLYCHASEVDGCAVIESAAELQSGDFVQGSVIGRAGFDLRFAL
jgi:ribosomal protein S12 methylthiotransferase